MVRHINYENINELNLNSEEVTIRRSTINEDNINNQLIFINDLNLILKIIITELGNNYINWRYYYV